MIISVGNLKYEVTTLPPNAIVSVSLYNPSVVELKDKKDGIEIVRKVDKSQLELGIIVDVI